MVHPSAAQGGFHSQRSFSPSTVAIVVAIHAAGVTALALAEMEMPTPPIFTDTIVKFIPAPVDPEPVPVEREVAKAPATETRLTPPDPIVDLSTRDPIVAPRPLDPVGPIGFDSPAPPAPQPLPEPAAEPLRVEARMDSRSVLQPPYPAAEQRAGTEGLVRVSVLIGADGRVKAVERVSSTSEAFFRATERHALRAWRFRPATADGRPIESRQVVTVRFELGR